MRGDVRLRIRGLMPEKLAERALEQGITFRRLSVGDDHILTVEVGERDARRLLRLCRRFSIPAEVISRRGGSAVRQWLRRRWTLAVGVALAAALCALALGRLWRVEVRFTGDAARRGDAEAILEWLEDRGIRPGIPRDIDTTTLSDELLSGLDGLSYAAARVRGVVLQIEAAPEVEAPEVYDVDEPRDLYADRAGIVLSVNAEAGEACVKPGDTVQRGQLVIRGAEKVSRDADRPIAALGQVVIRAWVEGHAQGPLRSEQVRYTGRRSAAAALVTPWFQLPITEGERFERQSETVDALPVGGLFIPVQVRRVTAWETELVLEQGDKELLSQRLVALATADMNARLNAVGTKRYRLAKSWIRYTQPSEDILRANAVCEIYIDTAVPWEALRQGG